MKFNIDPQFKKKFLTNQVWKGLFLKPIANISFNEQSHFLLEIMNKTKISTFPTSIHYFFKMLDTNDTHTNTDPKSQNSSCLHEGRKTSSNYR